MSGHTEVHREMPHEDRYRLASWGYTPRNVKDCGAPRKLEEARKQFPLDPSEGALIY